MTDHKSVPNVVEPSSPYYLGPEDQPGNLITHVILKGDDNWSRAIALSLKARRKFGFIDGTLTKPSGEKNVSDWETVNSMLVLWILRSIDPNVAVTIPIHDEARELWLYLEMIFYVSNGLRLQQLKVNILHCKQRKNESQGDYYVRLTNLYDELARLRPLYRCVCGKCTCNVTRKYTKDREEEIFHQFLVGVDGDLYGAVRSNLLSQNPLPDLDNAYNILLQEERVRHNLKVKGNGQGSIFSVVEREKGNKLEFKQDKAKLYCGHCKKPGHEESTCFKLHGKPEWWYKKYGG